MITTKAILELIAWTEEDSARGWTLDSMRRGSVRISLRDGWSRVDRVLTPCQVRTAQFDIVSVEAAECVKLLKLASTWRA